MSPFLFQDPIHDSTWQFSCLLHLLWSMTVSWTVGNNPVWNLRILALFFLTLTILRGSGQAFCRMSSIECPRCFSHGPSSGEKNEEISNKTMGGTKLSFSLLCYQIYETISGPKAKKFFSEPLRYCCLYRQWKLPECFLLVAIRKER